MELGILEDLSRRIQTKIEYLVEVSVKFGMFVQGEANFHGVLCIPRPFLAKKLSNLCNESEGHEETSPDCRMNLEWPKNLRISS